MQEELERQEAKAPGHLIVSFPSRLNGKSCFTKDEMRGFPFSRVQVHPFNKHSLTCSTSCPESKEMRLHVGFSRGAHTTTSSASTAAASAAKAHQACIMRDRGLQGESRFLAHPMSTAVCCPRTHEMSSNINSGRSMRDAWRTSPPSSEGA